MDIRDSSSFIWKSYNESTSISNLGVKKVTTEKTDEVTETDESKIAIGKEGIINEESETEVSSLIENAQSCEALLNEAIKEEGIIIRQKLGHAKTAADVVVKAEVLGQSVLNLIGGVKDISPHVLENLNLASTLLAEKSVNTGLNLLTQGLEALSYLDKIPEFQKKGVALAEKEEALARLQRESEEMISGSFSEEYSSSLNRQIKTLENEINALTKSRQSMITDTLTTVVKGALSDTSAAIAIAKMISEPVSRSADIIKLLAPSVGLVGSVVGTVFSGIALAKDLNLDEVVAKKFDELVEELKSTEPGSLLHSVILAKLHQLEQQSNDLGMSMVQNYVGVLSSTLGVGASIGGIVVGAGVAVGLGGAALITSSGIGALVLGTGVLIGGTAYMIHKNSDAIANGIDTAGVRINTELSGLQLRAIESDLAEHQSTIQQMEQFLKEAQAREQNIEDYRVERITDLSLDKITLRNLLPDEEQLSSGSLVDRMSAHIKKVSIEMKISDIDAKMEAVCEQVLGVKATEARMIQESKEQLLKSIGIKGEIEPELAKLKDRIKVLKAEHEDLKIKDEYIGMASKVRGMDWMAIKEFENKLALEIHKSLSNNMPILETLKNFLIDQDFDWEAEGFDANPAHALLKYITKEEAA